MNAIKRIFTPFQAISKLQEKLVILAWAMIAFLVWLYLMPLGFPKPRATWEAFIELMTQEGLVVHTWSSLTVQFQAVAFAVVISLTLSYLSVIKAFKPVVNFISAWRGVSPGALVVLTMVAFARNGHNLKVILMAFAIGTFYLTAMARVVADTTQASINHAYTLKMGPWTTTWEVVVRGRLHMAWEALVQNNLMGWSMLMMVEGLVQSEGGIGRLMYNDQKHSNLPSLLALALWSGTVALTFDLILRRIGKRLFKYVPKEAGQ